MRYVRYTYDDTDTDRQPFLDFHFTDKNSRVLDLPLLTEVFHQKV